MSKFLELFKLIEIGTALCSLSHSLYTFQLSLVPWTIAIQIEIAALSMIKENFLAVAASSTNHSFSLPCQLTFP